MQARRAQAQYAAARDAGSKPPPGGYGPLGVYGAVNDAVRHVSNEVYSPQAMYDAARVMTTGKGANTGGWDAQMYDPKTGAPNARGQAAIGLIPPGQAFTNPFGVAVRKNPDGSIAPVQ
jgi:hypothetical protein